MSFDVSLADIHDAKREIAKHLPPSPLLFNPWFTETLGCDVYLKLENMQPIGSFKIRGAINRVSRLTSEQKKLGVVAASAGNHAQGVAWAALRFGVKATIVMPKGATLMKIHNTRSLGAEVLLEGETFDEAVQFARGLAEKTGKILIPAFEDHDIISGQGTVGLEILEQLPDVECVLSAVGGGGLMAGICIAMKALKPTVKLIGCQANGAPSMIEAIKTGKPVKLAKTETFADGIAVGAATERMLSFLKPHVDRMLGADDEEMAAAVLMLLEKAKIVSEGAGALPLACLQQIPGELAGKKVVLVVSGGNIDVNLLGRIIDRGLIRAGRRVRVNVWISDRPGSLYRLTELIAREGASVIQAIHDRSEPSTRIDQTEVALTLETRGAEHSESLIRALEKHVIRLELAHS